MKEDEKLTKQ